LEIDTLIAKVLVRYIINSRNKNYIENYANIRKYLRTYDIK